MSVFALFGVFGPLFRVNEGSLNKPRLEDPVMELGDRAADAAGGLMKTLELLLGAYEGVGDGLRVLAVRPVSPPPEKVLSYWAELGVTGCELGGRAGEEE